MSSLLTNLLTFSPLLFLAGLILYVLDRAESLRRGAGLLPPEQPPLHHDPEDSEKADDEPPTPHDGYGQGLDESENSDGEEEEEEEEEAPTTALLPEEPIPDIETPTPQPASQPRDRTPRTRTVGAKKARSLARRDQRRAYHSFLQSQQSERARQAAAIAEEEEERSFEEKRRRALIADEITAKKERERALRIEAERRREEERRRDVDRVRGFVTTRGRKAWKLEEIAKVVGRDEMWVRETLRVEGLVGGKEGEWRMITGEGWYVVVGKAELGVLYAELEKRGKMEWGEMARVLEGTFV